MRSLLKLSILSLSFLLLVLSCSESGNETTDNSNNQDSYLFSEISTKSFTYYSGTPIITAARGNSPHGFIRIKFDSIAFSVLDAGQNLPNGKSFPNGSLIVKEVYSTINDSLTFYAVMKKNPSSSVSGNGYEWAEFRSNGKTYFSTGKKGVGCISCHAGGSNRDLVRTFDLH